MARSGRPVTGVIEWVVSRYVAFLRAVNVGGRRVAMATAREVLADLGLAQVSSFANSGNLIFSATGKAADHAAAVRLATEKRLGFELTTFIRTAAQVRRLVEQRPFCVLASGHTHLVFFTAEQADGLREESGRGDVERPRRGAGVRRDVHWLIRAKSTETTLGPKQWLDAFPGKPHHCAKHDDADRAGRASMSQAADDHARALIERKQSVPDSAATNLSRL